MRTPFNDVLVVDDDEEVRLLLCRAFLRAGMSCDTAIDGLDALDRIAAGRYALVLTDLMMPRLDGADFVTRLAGLQSTSSERPVVVMITAYPDSDRIGPLVDSVQAVMRKPFDINELTGIVRAVVDARRAHEAAYAQSSPPPPPSLNASRSALRTKSSS